MWFQINSIPEQNGENTILYFYTQRLRQEAEGRIAYR